MATSDTLEQALKSLIESTELYRQQADNRSDQLKQTIERLTKQVQQTNKQMGELSAKMGTLVEDMVSPDMLRILRQVANIPEEVPGVVNVRVKRIYPGKVLNGHSQMIELDAVAECGNYVLINETKNTFRSEYVTEFLAKLATVRDYFPEFANKKVLAAISSLRIEANIALQASRQGLWVLALGEGMLQLHNEPGFQPKFF